MKKTILKTVALSLVFFAAMSGNLALAQSAGSVSLTSANPVSTPSNRVALRNLESDNTTRSVTFDTSRKADRLFEKAKKAYKAGNYAEACELAKGAQDMIAADRSLAGTDQATYYAEKAAEYCKAATNA